MYSKVADGKYIAYKQQNGDGIIATAKTAVDISINLVGIMALFMGFMSIAEKAGGIRLLSKIVGAVLFKIIPGIAKKSSCDGPHGNEFFG